MCGVFSVNEGTGAGCYNRTEADGWTAASSKKDVSQEERLHLPIW